MAGKEPVTDLDPRFSSPGATPTPWTEGRERLERAEMYWLSTVRPDGRPHVTSLIAVWLDGALYFCTGLGERKAHNLERNARCVLATGSNALAEGLDVAVEGHAVRVRDETTLRRLAEAYAAKYGWPYTVRDGALHGDSGEALVFAVAPATAFGFGRAKKRLGERFHLADTSFSQTRWRF